MQLTKHLTYWNSIKITPTNQLPIYVEIRNNQYRFNDNGNCINTHFVLGNQVTNLVAPYGAKLDNRMIVSPWYPITDLGNRNYIDNYVAAVTNVHQLIAQRYNPVGD